MLIDPSVSSLAAAGLPGSLLSFGAPCLKWKLVAACKTHWGWTGYDSTISPPNKYLTKTVVYTTLYQTIIGGVVTSAQTETFTWQGNIDHISGAVTGGPNVYGEGLPGSTVSYQGDTQKTAIAGPTEIGSSYWETQTWVTTLSNPYTIAQLEGDVDALLGQVDPDLLAIQTLTVIAYAADNVPLGGSQAARLIPGGYAAISAGNVPFNPIPLTGSPASVSQPTLGPAAFSAYNPNLFLPDFGNAGMCKMVGWLAMAGDYCLKTFTVSQSGTPVGQPLCVNGRGTCSNWFKVTPPSPLVPGQETYVVAVPNSQCQG